MIFLSKSFDLFLRAYGHINGKNNVNVLALSYVGSQLLYGRVDMTEIIAVEYKRIL